MPAGKRCGPECRPLSAPTQAVATVTKQTRGATRRSRPSETVLDNLPVPQKGPFTKKDGERIVDERGQRTASRI